MKKSILTFIALLLAGVHTAWADGEVAEAFNASGVSQGQFAKVDDAVTAAGEGGTVKLIADIVCNVGNVGNVGISGTYTTTLDLNGHTITNETGSAITLYSSYPGGKTFTIKDSDPEKKGTITIKKKYPGDGCISDSYGRLVVIEGGTFNSDDNALYISSDGGWTINGGTFNGNVHVRSNVTINDGTFNGTIKSVGGGMDYSTSPATPIPANAVIKGGSFTGNPNLTQTDGNTISVSAGNFSSSVPEGFLAAGTLIGQNSNGSYSVVTEANAVASIGETKYATLSAAIAAATEGQTITLLNNTSTTAQITIDKKVTLDLNGKTISHTGTTLLPTGVIGVKRGGNLTIKDSAGDNSGKIESGAKAYAAIAVTVPGEAQTGDVAELTVESGTLSGDYYAISGNGSRHGTKITISGGVIMANHTEDNLGIYHPQDGELTISGGTITGYNSAIEVRSGTLNISGGTFTTTATTYSCDANGSGTTTVGAAVAIAQHTTNKAIDATISGGTFNASGEAVKLSVSNPQKNAFDNVAVSGLTNLIGDSNTIPAGYFWKEDEDGISTLTKAVASITAGGTTTYYDDFAEAVGAVANGQTITMWDNVELTADDQIACTLEAGQSFTITLGDSVITSNGGFVLLPVGVTVNTDKEADIFAPVNNVNSTVAKGVSNSGYAYECVASEVQIIDGENVTGYLTLADAFDAVQDGQTIKLLTNISLTKNIYGGRLDRGQAIYMQFGDFTVTKGSYSINLTSIAANARSAEPAANDVGGVIVYTDKQTDIFDAADEGEILLVGTTNDPNFPYYYQVVSETPDEAIAQNKQTGMLFSDLQMAIDMASAGNTIELLPAIENVTITKTVNINKGIILDGQNYKVTSSLEDEEAATHLYLPSPTAFRITGNGDVTINKLDLDVTFKTVQNNEYAYVNGGIGIQVDNNYANRLTVNYSTITTLSRGIDVHSASSSFYLDVKHTKIYAGDEDLTDDDEFDPMTEYIHTFEDDPYQRSRGINFGAVSGVKANIQFCEIAGFSYPINAGKNANHIEVNMIDCTTYGRATVNNWGNSNKFNLSKITAHAYNNQEEGDTETFAIVVDNEGYVYENNERIHVVASYNNYFLDDVKSIANVEVSDETLDTDATQKFVDLRGTDATVKITGDSGYDIDEDTWDRVGFMDNEQMHNLLDPAINNKIYFDDTAKAYFTFWFETIKPFEHDFGGEIGTKTVRLGISDSIDHTNLYPVIATYPKVMLTMTPEDFEGEPKNFYFETLKKAFASEYFISGAELLILDNITLNEDITPNLKRGEDFTLSFSDPSFKITLADKPVTDPSDPTEQYHILLNPLVKVYYDRDNNDDNLFAPSEPDYTDILELSYRPEYNVNQIVRSYIAANVYWSTDVNDTDPSMTYFWLFDEMFTNDVNAPVIFTPDAYARLEMDITLERDLKLPKAIDNFEWEEEDGTNTDPSRRLADDDEITEYWLDFNSADEYDTDLPLYTFDKGEYSISLKPGQWVYTTALTDVFSSGDPEYYVTYDVLKDVNGANEEKILLPRTVNESSQTVIFRYKYYLQKDGLAVTVDPATYCGDRLIPNFEVKKKVVVAGQETWVVLNGITSEEYDEKVAASVDPTNPVPLDMTGIDFIWHLVPPVSADDDSTYIDAKTYFQSIVIEGITFQGTRKADFTILPRDIKDVTASGNEQPWTENGYTPEQIKDLIKLIYYCNNHDNPANPELVKDVDYRISVAGESAQSAINYTYPAPTPYTYKGTFVQADATTVDYYITPDKASVAKNLIGDVARFLGALYRASGVTSITYDGGTYSWSTEPDELKGSNWRDASNNTLVSVIAGQFSPTNMPESLTITTDKGKITVNIHVTNESAPAPASTGMYLDVNTYPQVITITAIEGGNYTGTLKLDFTILPEDLIDISKCMVVSDATYTSDTLPPLKRRLKVILKDPATGTETVVDSAAYTLEIHGAPESYINAQTYSNAITIKGKSSYVPSGSPDGTPAVKGYYGSLDADYVIKPRDLADSLDVASENDNQGWVILEAYPEVNATTTTPDTYPVVWKNVNKLVPMINSFKAAETTEDKNNINLILKAKDDEGNDVTWLLHPQKDDDNTDVNESLIYDFSYTIEPSPMKDPGEYKVIFTGRGNFTGMREVKVMVLKDISADGILADVPLQIILGNEDLSTSDLQDVTIKDNDLGITLQPGVHYELEIRQGNDNPGNGNGDPKSDVIDVIKGDGVYFAHFKGLEPYYVNEKDTIFPAVFEYYSWDAKDNSKTPGTAAAYYNGQSYPDAYTIFRGPLAKPDSVTSIHIQLPGKAMKATIGGLPGNGASIDDDYEDFTLKGLVTLNVEQADGTAYPPLDFTVVGIDDEAFKGCNKLHWLDATALAGYKPENLSRSGIAPFGGYPVQSLVYLDGTQGADVSGTNYIYKKGDNDFRCEELKIYDDLKGDQQEIRENEGTYAWEFRNIYQFVADKVTNTRYFYANQHYTTCLPYKLQMPASMKVYTLDAASDNIFGFKELSLSELDEFTPYLLIPSKAGNMLNNAESTVVYVTPTAAENPGQLAPKSVTASGPTMYGTNIYMDGDDAAGMYIMQSKNTWKKIADGASYNGACILPMRAYIEPATVGPSREYITSRFTDAIESLNAEVAEDWSGAEVYDLQGRKVDTTKTTMRKGVYIVNGVKRVKK